MSKPWILAGSILLCLGAGAAYVYRHQVPSVGTRSASEPAAIAESVESNSDEANPDSPDVAAAVKAAAELELKNRLAEAAASAAKAEPKISSEEALQRVTAILAAARKSGKLMPNDFEQYLALQRHMTGKDRVAAIRQFKEMLESNTVDDSAVMSAL